MLRYCKYKEKIEIQAEALATFFRQSIDFRP